MVVVVLRSVAFVLLLVPLLAPAASAAVLVNPPMVPPTPPMNVQSSPGTDSVTVTWDPPIFFGGASEVTYRVYKGSSLVADGLDTTTYVDSVSSQGEGAAAASYFVTAVNEAGESASSGYGCLDLAGPGVDVGGCIGNAIALAFWVLDQVV